MRYCYLFVIGTVVTALLAVLAGVIVEWMKLPVPEDGPDVNILLLGKTGNGRSALGNNILGRYEFESRVSPTPLTRHSQLRRAQVGSRKISVVDTPGLHGDPSIGKAEDTIKDLVNTFSLCPRGYQAFLIVMNAVTRISQEELDTIRFVQIIFGENVFKHVIFVFTHKDTFVSSFGPARNTTEEFISYIDNQPLEMMNFLKKAGQRILFANSLEPDVYKNRLFHIDLIRMMDQIRKSHQGKAYTKACFEDAQEILKRDIIRRAEEEEKKKREYEKKIRAEVRAECPCPKHHDQKYDDKEIVVNFNFNIPYVDSIMKMAGYLFGGLKSLVGWINRHS